MVLILSNTPPPRSPDPECLVPVKPRGRERCADNLSPLPSRQQGRVRPPDAWKEVQHHHERPFLPSWNIRTNNRAAYQCWRHAHCVLAVPAGEKSKYSQSGVPHCSGERSFSTEGCVVREGEPRQRTLALCIDTRPPLPVERDGASLLEVKKRKRKNLTVLALSGISSGERYNPCMIKPRFLQRRLGFLVATRADSLPHGWNNGVSCLGGSTTKEQEPRTSALWCTVVYKRYGGGGRGGRLSFESRND